MPSLPELVADWDRVHESSLRTTDTGQHRRPYGRIFDALRDVSSLRFEHYSADSLPIFVEKLKVWLAQFPPADQPLAFLLASRIIFVTLRQFNSLLRILYAVHLKRILLEAVIRRNHWSFGSFERALPMLDGEMDATLFVGNSDSSPLNEFVHQNRDFFANRSARRLVGAELAFWTYAAQQEGPHNRRAARHFESRILASDPHVVGKRRLVILEDFAGSGSDIRRSLRELSRAQLPFREVIVAPVIATAAALDRIAARCAEVTTSRRVYRVCCAMVLPERLRCYGGPGSSYLDDYGPVENLSEEVRRISAEMFARQYRGHLPMAAQHGFGNLALAFSTFENCPDNSLPIIWTSVAGWKALYPRTSRII